MLTSAFKLRRTHEGRLTAWLYLVYINQPLMHIRVDHTMENEDEV